MTRVSLLEVLNNPLVGESARVTLEEPETTVEIENLADEILDSVNGRFTVSVIILACLQVIDKIGKILAERSEAVC